MGLGPLTDYELSRNGKITKVEGTETNEGPDRLIRGKASYRKKNGKLKGQKGSKYIEVEKGTFDDLKLTENNQTFKMESGESADEVFDFIAANVGVEVGKADLETGGGEQESVFLTSFDRDKVEGMTEYLTTRKDIDPGLKLNSLIHNHPNQGEDGKVGSSGPSGVPGGRTGDIPQAELLNRKFSGQDKSPSYFIWRAHRRYQYLEN